MKELQTIGTGGLTEVVPGAFRAAVGGKVGDGVARGPGGGDGGDGWKETVVSQKDVRQVM